MSAKILIVEDEPGLATTLKDRLQKEGHAVTVARDGNSGMEMATREPFDMMILDIMLPGQSGLAVCQKVRQLGSNAPILMLTARRQTMDKVVGLRTGADDYLTKPFKMLELLARVDALLRRAGTGKTAHGRYQFGDLQIDIRSTEVMREGRPVALSAKEFHLLRYFVEHRGATLSRDELLREVWGYGGQPTTRTVDVHVAWLRQKIEKDPKNPQFIHTIVGMGYKFVG
ncbi:MAG TPA: response regulator transcription factor [Candidatus Acidoferrales bacterium]|jgi:two-component system alkaline phosphatase synthesis response regulator PhoP|nr:response regulator transcription factor [Candidatus Acidoferrales bacterium]